MISAAVVFADGQVADFKGDKGTASITWDGETFTVAGDAPFLDLKQPDADETMVAFVVKGTCPA